MREIRRFVGFLLVLLLSFSPVNVMASSRVVENLDADFLVHEHVVLDGKRLPAEEFVLVVNLRDLDDGEFFEQLSELGDEMRYAIVLVGNHVHLLKNYDDTIDELQDDLVVLADMMNFYTEAKGAIFDEAHVDAALQYELESDRTKLKTNLAKYVAAINIPSIAVNMTGSCLQEYRSLCDLVYLSEYTNLHSGFLMANEIKTKSETPVFYYGGVEAAWYTSNVLLYDEEYSGQRGITNGISRVPGYYSDSEYILKYGGQITFNEFLSEYNGNDLMGDYFDSYGAEIITSAENSARIANMWGSWTMIRGAFATTSDVKDGTYKYTNIERALYFAHEELLNIENLYFLRRERSATESSMEGIIAAFDEWLQSRSRTTTMSDDAIVEVIVDAASSEKYSYGK